MFQRTINHNYPGAKSRLGNHVTKHTIKLQVNDSLGAKKSKTLVNP